VTPAPSVKTRNPAAGFREVGLNKMDEVISHGGPTRPGALAVWIQAIRAPSLSAAAIPVLLGVAVAARAGFFSLGRMILALVEALQ